MLAILLILIVLAILLPALGVSTDPNIMRIAAIVLVIVLVVWLVTGSGLSLR